jgi:hypothetical protein
MGIVGLKLSVEVNVTIHRIDELMQSNTRVLVGNDTRNPKLITALDGRKPKP